MFIKVVFSAKPVLNTIIFLSPGNIRNAIELWIYRILRNTLLYLRLGFLNTIDYVKSLEYIV